MNETETGDRLQLATSVLRISTCLRAIFRHLPLQRVKFREVCRMWRDVSDSSWQEVRSLSICYPDLDFASFSGNHKRIEVKTRSTTVASKLLQLCASHLEEFSYKSNYCYYPLPPIPLDLLSKNGNLKKFIIFEEECPSDESLAKIFNANRQIRHLQIHLYDIQRCLEYLTTDCLEHFHIEIPFWCSELHPNFICENENTHDEFMATVEKIIDTSPRLKELIVCEVDDDILPVIGKKVDLAHLELFADNMIGFTEAGLSSIMTLSDLRSVRINTVFAAITDNFLMDLAKSCEKLEFFQLEPCHKITDNGVDSLLSLTNFKKLYLISAYKITNECIKKMSKIEELIIFRGNLTTETIEHLLHSCPSLHYINLRSGKLKIENLKDIVDDIVKESKCSAEVQLIVNRLNILPRSSRNGRVYYNN